MRKHKDFSIRKWYGIVYPSDELGEELRDDISFNDLFICLNKNKDVYDYLGVADSLVRERIFNQLAIIMGVNYDYIYNLWVA